MPPILGTAGHDDYTGTSGADSYDMSQGGADTLHGLAGNDSFFFGPAFTATDKVDGGDDEDTVTLQGSYGFQIVFAADTITNVENLVLLDGGSNYNLKLNDGNVAAAQDLFIDASGLTLGHKLMFDGSAETDGTFSVKGSDGNDQLILGAGADHFDTGLGIDSVSGGGGNDVINVMDTRVVIDGGAGGENITFNRALTAADRVDGGADYDQVNLFHGENLTLNATTLTNVEQIRFTGASSFNLISDDANVAAGKQLIIDGNQLAASVNLTFNGSNETDGTFYLIGGGGNDVLTGGALGDRFSVDLGGDDTANGGGGDDSFSFYGGFTANDKVNGGGGTGDLVELNGNYSAGVVFLATTMTNVEILQLDPGGTYKLVTHDATVAMGRVLTVNADSVAALIFDGSKETNGSFVINSGGGADTLTGGVGGDVIHAGSGADMLNGGEGDDTLDGGLGNDTASYSSAKGGVNVDLGKAVAQNTGAAGVDTLISIENLNGSSHNDHLSGGAGVNILRGAAGDDVLNGGAGGDDLNGGGGADTFVISALNHSTTAAPDTIHDFTLGDLIDLHLIDADTSAPGNQAFHLGATPGHTGDIVQSFDAVNNRTVLDLYVNNDATVDARIWLSGNHLMSATDFVL